MADLTNGLLGCYRCAHLWRPAHPRRPRLCPRCKSRFWDVPILRPIRLGRRSGIAEVLLPHRDAVLKAARARGFRHLRVFGSVRLAKATRASDVDLLVDRDDGASLLDRAALIGDLEAILGRKVDIVPEEALHWLVRPQVLFEAVPL